MPLRTRLKRLIAGSEGKETQTADEPGQTDGKQRPVNLQRNDTNLWPASGHATHPQSFQLGALWDEAYEQLREEDEQLVIAFEKDLLTQGKEQPGDHDHHAVLDDSHETRLQNLVERRLADIQETRLQFTVGGRDIVVKDQARRIIHAILAVKDFISSAVSSEPHAALAWAGILVLLNPVSKAITQEEDAIDGFEQISNLLIRYRLLECTHVEIYASTNSSSRGSKYQMRLAKQYSHSGLFRFVKDLAAPDNWKNMLESITEIDSDIKEDLEFLGGHALKEIGNTIENLQRQMSASLDLITEARDEAKASKQLQLLEKLPYAEGAVFNSYEDRGRRHCLAGTQVEILSKIQEWIEDPNGPQIFWLRGMAGTGKSTISRTFAAASHDRTRLITGEPLPNNLCLGASFFFNQYEPLRNNAKRLFTTLAWSMAGVIPSLKALVCDAIDKNPRIGDELPENQWKYLIYQPLLELETQILSPLTLIVVIDALDECKPESDLGLILQLMSHVKELQTIKIRFFLTSRPEAHIRSCFRGVSPSLIYEAVLNKVTVSDCKENVQDDIMRFLKHELEAIQQKNQITEDWPGQDNLQKLSIKADGLFIYAATACRFLDGPNLTRSRLDLRLKMIFDNKVTGDSPQKNLDAIYTSILQFSVFGDVIEEEKPEISSLFKQVVGSIVVLFEPLSAQYLSTLVDTPLSSVEETLKGLHSVLAVPEKSNDTVQLLHLSFRDFLIDSQRCLDDNFHISEVVAHDTLFQRSLEIMSNLLHYDICCLLDPATSMSDVEQSRISKHIPIHLQYACRHWVFHLQHGGVQPTDNGEVHQFLQIHILHWLEAISLLGRMHEGVQMILVLFDYLATLPAENRTELKFLVQDTRRFVLKFRSMIESRPLQIYNSALVFSPKASVVRSLFKDHIPKWLHQMPTTDPQWDPLLQTLDSRSVYDVAISPDGKLVASTSGRIWDTSTGTLVKQLEYSYGSTRAEFSQDGKGLIAVTYLGTVMKWDVATGLLILEINTGHQGTSIAVFSQNRNMVAIGGNLGGTTITIIDIVGKGYVKIESAHSRKIEALAISPDGACLASASMDEEVCLWDTTTTGLRRTLKGNCDRVSIVAFSPNGQVLASADMTKRVYLWHAGTGAALATIGYSTIIEFLAFSPDSSLLASTGRDGSLCLWEAATGAFLRKLDGDFCAPLFSPNGDFLTSISGQRGYIDSFSGGIKLWETDSGRLAKAVADFGYIANNMSFSPDGTVLASASRSTGIQLWDLTIEAKRPSCSAHARSVKSVALVSSAERAVSFAEHDSVMLWDVITADFLSTISVAGRSSSKMVLSTDGTLIATSRAEILDSGTGKLLRTLTGHTDDIHTMVFTSDSRFLASACHNFIPKPRHHRAWSAKGGYEQDNPDSPDASIRLWDAKTGELLQKFHGPLVYLNCLSFSIDGTVLAAAYQDGSVHLWNARTGDFFKALEGHPDAVMDVTFSSDGKTVASTSDDGKVRLWDVDTGEITRILQYPEGLGLASFSPNGKLLATVTFYYDDVQLWNPTTGELLATFKDMVDVDSLIFSEDSEYLDTRMGRLSIEMIRPGLSNSESLKRDPGIFVKNPWVFRGTEKILLLPGEYYATCASYRDGVLVMGHENGRVSIIRFDQDEIIGSV